MCIDSESSGYRCKMNFLYVFLPFFISICNGRSVIGPDDAHVLIGENALFSCSAMGGNITLTWTYNGKMINDSRDDFNITYTLDSGGVSSILSVMSVSNADNDHIIPISIECIATVYDRSSNNIDVTTKGAKLFIHHISPVENLTFEITSSSSIMLQWDEPKFSSDLVSQLKYHIIVRVDGNVSFDENTPDTTLDINIQPCKLYTITIFANGGVNYLMSDYRHLVYSTISTYGEFCKPHTRGGCARVITCYIATSRNCIPAIQTVLE